MPKKHLGQHFLTDRGILKRIADFARVGGSDTVVEIGPGRGTLTQVLAERAARVIAVEVDSDLVARLRTTLPANCDLIEADALTLDFRRSDWGRYHIVSNLPYNIATPLVEAFTSARESIEGATIMVQKEVAERMLARPHSKPYGVLSVRLQYHASVEAGFNVAPGAFTPPPKVWSKLVRLAWKPGVADAPDLMDLVGRAFAARRKKLVNNLTGAFPNIPRSHLLALLQDAGIDPEARAENLSVEDFTRLHHALKLGSEP